MKRAFITGITGQDGYYLGKLLVEKGYHVTGMVRGQSNPRRAVVERDLPDVHLVEGDLLDQGCLRRLLEEAQPDEVYNLASISFVPLSWGQPNLVSDVTGTGVLNVLEAVRSVMGATASCPARFEGIRFYQASSSEMFGKVIETPQTEKTPFYPRSPYGVAKCYGHNMTINYRESYGLFASSGILFNHESPRRPVQFVTRKVTHAAARIARGLQSELLMGNTDSQRDWGHAADFVEAMWLMLQAPTPDSFVVGTGTLHSVEQLCAFAFERVGLNWRDYVRTDPRFVRPAEVDLLLADPSKARDVLGWTPKVSFEQLIGEMVDNDLQECAG